MVADDFAKKLENLKSEQEKEHFYRDVLGMPGDLASVAASAEISGNTRRLQECFAIFNKPAEKPQEPEKRQDKINVWGAY